MEFQNDATRVFLTNQIVAFVETANQKLTSKTLIWKPTKAWQFLKTATKILTDTTEVALWLAGALELDIWLAEGAIYIAPVWKPSGIEGKRIDGFGVLFELKWCLNLI